MSETYKCPPSGVMWQILFLGDKCIGDATLLIFVFWYFLPTKASPLNGIQKQCDIMCFLRTDMATQTYMKLSGF